MGDAARASMLFATLFLSWIKAVPCIAAAVLVRPRAASIAIAAVIGITVDCADMGFDLFISQITDPDRFVMLQLGLSALTGLAWWCIGRAGFALARLMRETVRVRRAAPPLDLE